jgi:hypothetical protein
MDIDSMALLSQVQQVALYLHLEPIWTVLSFLGLSGGVLILGLYWIYQKIFWKIVLPYLFSGIPKD